VTINVLLSDIVIICAISLCSVLVAVFRRFVGAGESVESSDLHPGSVARSVFCNLLFRASFVKINDVVRPVIRCVMLILCRVYMPAVPVSTLSC